VTGVLRRTLPLLPALVLTTLLAACGGEESADGAAGSDGPFNDSDVTFATEMIPHHAQAGLMVDMTLGRKLDPEVLALAEGIRQEQSVEVETMVDWLTEWDQPVPETMRDHANAHSHEGEESDLEELESLSGGEFEQQWLEMMIEHHEGAIEMAEAEIEDGKFPDAVKLAEDIRDSQQAEIDQMEQMLG
jgi:uncharacterized protein (DUF305 family)